MRVKRAEGDERLGRRVEDTFFGEDPLQHFRGFAAPVRDIAREPDALLCRHLRARVWDVTHPAIEDSGPVSPYCCLKTLSRQGPDGNSARPDDCTEERGCFEPADRFRDPES